MSWLDLEVSPLAFVLVFAGIAWLVPAPPVTPDVVVTPLAPRVHVAATPLLTELPVAEADRKATFVERLAREYKVGRDLAVRVVDAAFDAGRAQGVAPELLLAVIATESGFNPKARSPVGALGLMQVLPRWHKKRIRKLAGRRSILNVEANLAVGANILREAYERAGGDLRKALLRYNGATSAMSRYPGKVMARLAWLRGEVEA